MKFEKEHKRVNITTTTTTTAETSSQQPLFTKFRFTPTISEYKYVGNQEEEEEDTPSIELNNHPPTTRGGGASNVQQQQQAQQDEDENQNTTDMDTSIFVKIETPEHYKKLSIVGMYYTTHCVAV